MAAQLLRVTSRQAFRLLKAYRIGGPAALLSKKRGKPSNRAYPAASPPSTAPPPGRT
ncbi:helix-turn-helix domain-containing protein [Bradyrhizobium sp. NBAIM20]|uniref:helix-turn-helix domain-containing protein n=1 Tax=Bradyrhizobium TaxID=374 RepID=UPI0034E19785